MHGTFASLSLALLLAGLVACSSEPAPAPPDLGTDFGATGDCVEGELRPVECLPCGVAEERCEGGAWVRGACDDTGCDPDACESFGDEETRACGNCGEQTRRCDVDGTWTEFGPCTGQGECAPRSTRMADCGNCGSQPLECTSSCEWEPTEACSGEGECAPGDEGDLTDEGCTEDFEARDVTCSAACAFEPGMCTYQGLDLMVLIDGHDSDFYTAETRAALANGVSRLLDRHPINEVSLATFGALRNTRIVEPFVARTSAVRSLREFLSAFDTIDTSRASDGANVGQALGVVAGLTPHSSYVTFECDSGRLSGGCWRELSERIIVVFADDIFDNDPLDRVPTTEVGGEVVHSWDDVATALSGIEAQLWVVSRGSVGSWAPAQMSIGGDPAERVFATRDRPSIAAAIEDLFAAL
ncbi:MAG: vWA domain-containing protein [Myxococcota bacterium]